ncbi:MAG: flavin reductase family protein [Algisphaera sp.]
MAAPPYPDPKDQPELMHAIRKSLNKIPNGLFVLTAEHEDRRGGMVVSWVQQVCDSPPMVSVAIEKGKAIMPLISESRKFALCQLSDNDRLMQRKFAQDSEINEDPFLGFSLRESVQGKVPIMTDSMAWLECHLSCHMDVEGDHDLFVGAICGGGTNGRGDDPLVRYTPVPALEDLEENAEAQRNGKKSSGKK